MLKSMTAYGRASIETKQGRFVLEIQSVNRKFLEIAVYLPKELLRFEGYIRKLIGANVDRGQVNVRLSVAFDNSIPLEVIPNLPLARGLKKAWSQIAQELAIKEDFTLKLLARQEDIIFYNDEIRDEEKYQEAIKEVCKNALENFVEMKLREGAEIQKDMEGRLQKLSSCITTIEQLGGGATEKYRQKLVGRLNEVLGSSVETEESLMREVALFAEKIDIAEEIVRYKSHLKELNRILDLSEKSVGKTLEFMLQELHREINTIGSKSADARISHLVVEMKSLQEQIREQIQNIE